VGRRRDTASKLEYPIARYMVRETKRGEEEWDTKAVTRKIMLKDLFFHYEASHILKSR
jgi:hypothetical protein